MKALIGKSVKNPAKRLPRFKSESDERKFWSPHDTLNYFDFSKSRRVKIEFEPRVMAQVKQKAKKDK
jgi:hypothetical protein